MVEGNQPGDFNFLYTFNAPDMVGLLGNLNAKVILDFSQDNIVYDHFNTSDETIQCRY